MNIFVQNLPQINDLGILLNANDEQRKMLAIKCLATENRQPCYDFEIPFKKTILIKHLESLSLKNGKINEYTIVKVGFIQMILKQL